MFVIGVTGGIGCGKSTVAMLCREAGITVLDADQISRSVTSVGGSALAAILEEFGPTVFQEDGSLDRKAVSDMVFQDKKRLDHLSIIVHKEVLAEMERQLVMKEKSGEKVLLLDVPIPVKHGFLDRCDQVWSVWADEPLRLARLEARGMSRAEAQRRIAVQLSREEYEALANIHIDNSGHFDELRAQVNAILREELGSRGLPYRSI